MSEPATRAPEPRSETLRLATLNVWALPFGIARHVPERMEATGRRVAELELDLVAYQEVWTEPARAALLVAGRRAGLVHAWHRRRNPRSGSGLLVLSRRPFLGRPSFARFALRGLPQRIHHGDYWGGKGFVLARVATTAGPLTVLNTHLQAQYTPDPIDEYRGIRTGQIAELAYDLRAVGDPVVALGDFNVREGNPDHGVLMGLTRFADVALALGRPQDTVTRPHPYRGAGHGGAGKTSGERIDYVFTRTGRRADALPVSIERDFDARFRVGGEDATCSDHAGLWAEVEIAPVPPRPLPAALPVALARARSLFAQGRGEALRRQGVVRSLALGGAALAVAALPGAAQIRASRRHFLAGVVAGVGVAALPGAAAAAWLSEVGVPRELDTYDYLETLLSTFVPAA